MAHYAMKLLGYTLRKFHRRSIFSLTGDSNNRKEYSEKRAIGFTANEMFNVVANVSEYPEFIPWCRKVETQIQSLNLFTAVMTIGFPPIETSYTARVTLFKPTVVRSVCIDGHLFRQLDTTFRFGEGLPGNDHSCTLYYDLVFEFRSVWHSQLAHVFFDQVVITMVTAFLKRAEHMYGPPSINHFEQCTVLKKVK